ncbi:hypothetical protein OVA24_16700 [Luteolibacter sp. SL250]|uniref:hypothetical protein n=1 Tax=Luteolibacter sp. SL250 TaxID=2995170 RepID=UPI002270C5B3|nr:hypothetical protein [Luteolibacter sp. SL250]WAC18872.1 hypothetical protein OVA24_16700 [Luteolibacter sp. SL250]
MDPARITIIRRTILETLKNAQGYAVEVSILRNFVSTLLRPPVTDEEWANHIAWLVKGGFIVLVPSDLDDSIQQYAITERGRVLLATL